MAGSVAPATTRSLPDGPKIRARRFSLHMKNTLLIDQTRSGRIAVMARKDPASPWMQVDSVLTARDASLYTAQLEESAEIRNDAIYEWRAENWGDDAPTVDPNLVKEAER